MLGRFATSAVPRQRQIQQCMVASLLDEFSHFDEYPDRERQVVTQFCGALLNAGVLQGPDLSWCLEALVGCLSSSPPGAKMFVFATEALRMALSRFPTWPHLCTALSNVRGLEVNARDIHAAAVSALRAASARASAAAAPASAPAPASSAAPGPASQGDLAQAGSQGAAAGPASGPAAQAGPQLPTLEREMQAQMQGVKVRGRCRRADVTGLLGVVYLVEARGCCYLVWRELRILPAAQVPTTGEQEKVMFAFNNLDPDNVSSKAGDIWRIVSRGYEKWFSNYVVVKRAAQEVPPAAAPLRCLPGR